MCTVSYIQSAIQAAHDAGKILMAHYGKLTQVTKKGRIDLVTAADVASEAAILTVIKTAYPDHTTITEESGSNLGLTAHKWIIDPLDGTTNFVHSLPVFAVSIAHCLNDIVDLGVVFNPFSGELFCATRGGGATLNGKPITVSKTQDLEDSLLVTGFPYNLDRDCNLLMDRFKRCLLASQGIRRLGSAALDLCYVACARFDGFWEQRLNPWDTAAGMIIVFEAGGHISDFAGRHFHLNSSEILASNGQIHTQLIDCLTQKESS